MAGKPKFRVLPNGTEDKYPAYEIVMPDGNCFRYVYGKMLKVKPKPLTRMKKAREVEPWSEPSGFSRRPVLKFDEEHQLIYMGRD